MAVATVDETGLPNVRMVLLKGVDEAGFVFYTNFGSRKGREILASQKAALLFHWKSLRRQVRVRGRVEVVSDAEADTYYASRPRGSRIGAWASKQSQPLEGRFALEAAVAQYTVKFGSAISRDRTTGPAFAWCRRRWSSGMTGRSDCTTGSSSRVAARTMRG